MQPSSQEYDGTQYDSVSKLEKVTSMNCPGGSWMSQPMSTLFGYCPGYPGEVITPLGSVSVVNGTVNEWMALSQENWFCFLYIRHLKGTNG